MIQVSRARVIGAFDAQNCSKRGSHSPRIVRARIRWESFHVKTILMLDLSLLAVVAEYANGGNMSD